ncbi:MAG: methyltransferase domain-containing protein [Parachlamydiales bacterium]|nr:methyltransferase domain-containing protein [Parachlamydiales bacterium]
MKRLLTYISTCLLTTSCMFAQADMIPPEDYQKNSSLQWRWALDCLERNPLSEDMSVLDIGCGDGKITSFMADFFENTTVLGIDCSQKSIDFCNFQFPQDQHPNLSFDVKDACRLQGYEVYNRVFAFCTLHWLHDINSAISGVYNTLKPEGKFIFFVPGPCTYNISTIGKALENNEEWKDYFTDFNDPRWYYSQDEYVDMLESVGFSIDYRLSDEESDYFPSLEALKNWCRPLCMQANHLPTPELREAFLSQVMTILEPSLKPAHDGGYYIVGEKIEICASK